MSVKIAVIGMACKFPEANNLEEYWNNLISGKNSIKYFNDNEIKDTFFESNRKDAAYVKAHGILDDIDRFDAHFFEMTPKEAAETDPQHRFWLETVWKALENAGCDPFTYKGAIGVFAGGAQSSYLLNNILGNTKTRKDYLSGKSSMQIMLGNEATYIPSRTAYKLNLKGPAINVQTACSTSLVAVIQACQSLYSYESDMCITGGVCLNIPQEVGYFFEEGSINSPDGFCRPFDDQAKGTVGGNGVGAVILKRLEEALEDGDRIYAVVSGWALNNDGSRKVSYTAPSVDGQAEVIMMAQSFAEVLPDDISYIEAHGTATELGDPIEVAALTKAFSAKTNKKQFCGIGSVKSNIGHTDVAAGVASFIKVCLSSFYKKIPPTINFTKPNSKIDFNNSPFYVQKDLREWTEKRPLIMGVSSFGIGGTNAHLIVEEAPLNSGPTTSSSKFPQLLLLSAKSNYSLEKRKHDLTDFLKNNSTTNIDDVAYSLSLRRHHMPIRSFFVADEEKLKDNEPVFIDSTISDSIPSIAFIFPGQGAQYLCMGQELYSSNHYFRSILDQCFALVEAETGVDYKKIIFQNSNNDEISARLSQTEITQPSLFIIEYALAKTLIQFDIKPNYMIGHSIGEYVAACIAGVFDLKTAIRIVLKRGQLMQRMPRGEMMAVRADEAVLKILQSDLFEIAAINSPISSTISLKPQNREKLIHLLNENSVSFIKLDTSHGFHSSDFDPILDQFEDFVNSFNLSAPAIPFISCLTGNFISEAEAKSGRYWAKQLRNTVRFSNGINYIRETSDNILFLEVGPNNHLSKILKQYPEIPKTDIFASLMSHESKNEQINFLTLLGCLWLRGINLDFNQLFESEKVKFVPLPVYQFDRKRYWIDSETELSPSPEVTIDNTVTIYENPDELIRDYTNQKYVPPVNETQRKLIKIWEEQIGHKNIGILDNFFDIGGNSLLSISITSKIEQVFNIQVSMKELFSSPKIKDFAEFIDISCNFKNYKNDNKTNFKEGEI